MSNGRSGWVTFSWIVLVVAGAADVLYAVAALGRKEYFPEGGLIYESLQSHGWVWLIIGAIELVVGIAIAYRQPWARTVGIILASCAAVVWFFYLLYVPLAGIAMITLALLVLYGLVAHGEDYV
jgi:hypothetical protein